MKRVTIFACAGAGLVFAGLAWLLAAAPSARARISADMLGRSAGVALLGLVLIAAGMAFRAALRAEQKPAAATIRPRASEYRRGFGERVTRVQARAAQRDAVRSLRRAIAEHGQRPMPAAAGTTLPKAEIERLH